MLNPDLKKKWAEFVVHWELTNGRHYPWRWTDDPYRVLIAEVLLKRTTSTAASRLYNEFLKRYPDVFSLSRAHTKDLKDLLKDIGLHRQRARQLKAMSEYIVEVYGGEIPPDYQKLLKIPGVGDYTASAILVFGYGIPKAVVDSNVERTITRAFLVDKKCVKRLAEELTPKEAKEKFLKAYTYGLIDLGGLVCHYRYPKCKSCPLKEICQTHRSSVK